MASSSSSCCCGMVLQESLSDAVMYPISYLLSLRWGSRLPLSSRTFLSSRAKEKGGSSEAYRPRMISLHFSRSLFSSSSFDDVVAEPDKNTFCFALDYSASFLECLVFLERLVFFTIFFTIFFTTFFVFVFCTSPVKIQPALPLLLVSKTRSLKRDSTV